MVNGGRNGARSGAQTLATLAAPLNCLILRALSEGPKPQAELQQKTGSPAQTTLRAQLKRLTEIGALEKHRRNRFPGVLEYELTPAGRELLFVLDVLGQWLGQAPGGPLVLGGGEAKAAIKALAEGWSTTMLRALAAGPLSLTELDDVIASLSYPSLERRLAAMRLAGLVAPCPGNSRGTPYGVTDLLRRGIAPLVAAAQWERRNLPRLTAPVGQLDVEAAFLLAIPLLRPDTALSGSCRLAAEISNGERQHLAGVFVEVREGAVGSCTTTVRGPADARALGSSAAWFDAVIGHDVSRLELGGNRRLASALVNGLHESLFDPHPAIHP